FLFAGFPPATQSARRSFLSELATISATLILYESPKRLSKTLADCAELLGPDRDAAVCRELTKKFEEVSRAPLGDLAEMFSERTVKGEIALCIGKGEVHVSEQELEAALRDAMAEMRLKDAAAEVAERYGASRRDLYQMGLRLKGGD
ncbi:MAG: rRNA (cytidine-2'-O-)-methyltransferase, partial [Silicimonas sp.]|nr:rRNA (cytidine-2'-O-)-methyltransferase [Silicimonas sp.]